MPGKYPATLSYLKYLLANVADLTEAVDTDLANPQFMADLAAFRDGERTDPPEGKTLAVLGRLDGNNTKRELSELRERASEEFGKRMTEICGRVNAGLYVASAGLNSAYDALRNHCEESRRNGKLHSLPRFYTFWDVMRLARFMEQDTMAGPLRTTRRPRFPTADENANVLAGWLAQYSEPWHWSHLHNERVKNIRGLEMHRPKYKSGMAPEQVTEFAEANAMIEYQEAIHFCDSLAEYEIGRLLREVCPQFLEYLPADIPQDTRVEKPDERAKAYRKLEGLVLGELKRRREAVEPPNAGNPATVVNAEPLTKIEAKKKPNGRAKQPGRKPLDDATIAKRNKLLENWQRAKEAGELQKVFCKANGVTIKHLKNCIEWAATRRRRGQTVAPTNPVKGK